VAEAMMALVLADHFLRHRAQWGSHKTRHSGESRNPINVREIPAFAGMTNVG
jgi:hypothetical protein